MGILGHIFGSALTGGLFGLIGNIAAKLFAFLDAKQQFAERQAQWTYQAELLKLRTPQTSPASQPVAQDWPALNETLKADGAIAASYRWVDAVRALVRPALTLGLVAVLAFAFFAMTPSDAERSYVTDSLVFAAVTAIVWWFGDRAPGRRR